MYDATAKVLEEAVARNGGAVLSLPSAGMLRHYKSRFLGDDPEGLWLESAPHDAALVDQLIASASPVGVSFKTGQNKAIFSSRLLKRDPAYRINASVTVEAVLVEQPRQVKVVQRRLSYRVRVPDDFELALRIWRIGKDAHLADRPMAAAEVPVQLWDISIGGLGVLLHKHNGQFPRIGCDDRLRIELAIRDDRLLMEGRLCYGPRQVSDTSARAGIQFQALEDDIEGRRTSALLTRIVGELQRLELRRHRLGVA